MSSYERTGVISIAEYFALPGVPDIETYKKHKGGLACIECIEPIPCNPCETMCPHGAIKVGDNITNLPVLDETKCTGCKLCISSCPGQAIFVIDYSISKKTAAISLPYEFLPLPAVNEQVMLLNREGKTIGRATVTSIKTGEKFDKTAVITVEVDKNLAFEGRNIKPVV